MNLRLLVLLSLIVTAVTYSQELEKHRLDKIDGLREVTHIAQKGVDLRWPKFSPDGQWIAYTSTPPDSSRTSLWMARVNDLNPILLVEKAIANDTEQYTWSPDGRRIAYVDQRAVKLLNLETRSVTSYNSGSPAMSDPVFDEAGNLGILMNTNLFGNSVALEGDLEQVKRLTPNDRPYLRVVEKDGKSFNLIQQPSALVEPSLIIPYIFRPGGEVYLNIGGIDRKITPPAYLPDSSPNCLDAILSPDRGKVLVSCMGTKVRLFVYEIAADKRYDLGEIAQPSSWSPDSEYVLYQLEISDGHAVDRHDFYIVHYTGGERVKFARAKGTVYGASWGKDGLIAYDEEGKIILGKITMK